MRKMAPRQIEHVARQKLEEMFGLSLPKRKLVVGHDSRDFPIIHEFDLVSDDRQIVGEITSTTCGYDKTLKDSFFLSKTKAKRKLLILTNGKFHKLFRQKYGGLLPYGVEVLFLKINET